MLRFKKEGREALGQRPEGDEGGSQVDTGGKGNQAEGTARVKVQRLEWCLVCSWSRGNKGVSERR